MADSRICVLSFTTQLIATIRSDLLTRFQQDVVLRRMDAGFTAGYRLLPYIRWHMVISELSGRNMLPDMCDEDWLYRRARISVVLGKMPYLRRICTLRGIAGTPEIAGTQIQRDDPELLHDPADGESFRRPVTCAGYC